ncbi:hypothetical protein, partial [Roseofilum sp. Guam]|uniref:hypothetical protein n=1 Tax=Roseofilum sp. Guam TaxID=2821502 RepID=UPI001B0A5916
LEEELVEMEEDPFASSETEELWETEELSETSALEESLEEELVEMEKEPFASSEAEELWEEETSEPSALEESLEEELVGMEDDPFASSEEELWEEERSMPPALEESLETEGLVEMEEDPFPMAETEELWEEIEESESATFTSSEEDLSTEDLWQEETETAPAQWAESLEEGLGVGDDPFSSSEEELLLDESQESLWEKIEEAEGDPFSSADQQPLGIPEASEEEEAEILSAFEMDTMSETIWNDMSSSEETSVETEALLDVFEPEEEEVQIPLDLPDFSSEMTEEYGEAEETDADLLDVFGDTEELDFPLGDQSNAIAEDRASAQALSDAKAIEEIGADMGDLWEDSPVSHTAPTEVEPELEGMIDEFAQEELDSFGESVQDSILDHSDGLEALLSEDWEKEEEITPPAITEELMLEEDDEVDPLADLFAEEDDATDPFAESLDLSEGSTQQEESELFDALGDDPFADLEDPFEEKKS